MVEVDAPSGFEKKLRPGAGKFGRRRLSDEEEEANSDEEREEAREIWEGGKIGGLRSKIEERVVEYIYEKRKGKRRVKKVRVGV